MNKIIKMIKNDIKQLNLYNNDIEYKNKLTFVNTIFNILRIDDETTYYKYGISIDEFKIFSYEEVTFLNRIGNCEYFELINALINREKIIDTKSILSEEGVYYNNKKR